jgi:hypothetical protein
VKLAILSAVASWAVRSADAVQLDLVSFIASGLKEKEVLRRGHLRCVRVICRNADAVLRVGCPFKLYQCFVALFQRILSEFDFNSC